MIRSLKFALVAMLGLGMSAWLSAADEHADHKKAAGAVAKIQGAGDHKDKIKGQLTFTEVKEGVKVTGEVTGLTPGKHGFHVHEKGDLSDPALKSAGGHFNPNKHKHGGPDSEERHAGDWGNILADDKGVAKVEGVFKGVTLSGEKDGIAGRSVIIHAKEDDAKTDPAGNAGDRIAGGVIEVKKAEK